MTRFKSAPLSVFWALFLLGSVPLLGEEPGFVVFATPEYEASTISFFQGKCVIFRPLVDPAWAKPGAPNLEELLTAEIHNVAWQSRRKANDGTAYFELPGSCKKSRLWIVVPQAHHALGRVDADKVDESHAAVAATLLAPPEFLTMMALKIQALGPFRRYQAEIEQVVWNVMQTENVTGYVQSNIYGLFMRLNEKGEAKPLPILLREVALEGDLERAATAGVRKILGLLATQRLDDQWLVNLASRIPNPTGVSSSVSVPETNAAIEIPLATKGSPSEINIVDLQSRVSLSLVDADIVRLGMPSGCSLRAREGARVVVIRPDKGVLAVSPGTNICSVISPVGSAGRSCQCQPDSRRIVEMGVFRVEKTSASPGIQRFARSCFYEPRCTLWATVDSFGRCEIAPVCAESKVTPKFQAQLAPPCRLDKAGSSILCDMREDAASTNDCLKLIGDSWTLVFPELQGLPLCQSLQRE